MPTSLCLKAVCLPIFATLAFTSSATIRYVNVNNPAPISPFTNWSTAAITIQDAVDVANTADEIIVTNGVYSVGGRAVYTSMTNRVVINKSVKVHSVNGPDVTVIQGRQSSMTTNGPDAIRCVYLASGATLSGFTLTNGATLNSGDFSQGQGGGGVWCASFSAVVSNCVIVGNSANFYGGGSQSGSLVDCTLKDNFCFNQGGGSSSGILLNCLLLRNSSTYSGGGAFHPFATNCTYAFNSSVNGGGNDHGTNSFCYYLTNSADYGGGAYLGSANNCTIIGNVSRIGFGGGASGVTLNNCFIMGNSATTWGGGVASGTANNCTITHNSAFSFGGGAYNCGLNNCIVFYNTAPTNANYSGGSMNYCCTAPLPSSGTGNLTAEPQLSSQSHLSAFSPCRGAGSATYAKGVDIDSENWAVPPSIGCDEIISGSATGTLSASIQIFTKVLVGFPLTATADIVGRVTASQWDFGDGTILSNQPSCSHAWNAPGDFEVVLTGYNDSSPSGISTTVTVHVVSQATNYVALGNSGGISPYASWSTAATNIQDAVDVAAAGAVVLVSNGVYRTGARMVFGSLSNRVVVILPVSLKSVGGPAVTSIEGYQIPGTKNGDSAIRCIYLANGASLNGFTLTNGATRSSGDLYLERSGGGIWAASPDVPIFNCRLLGNVASYLGGGAYSGTLQRSTLFGNSAASGGGACASALIACAITANSVSNTGGGAFKASVTNCTLTGNSALIGGGAASSSLHNSILYYNTATNVANANYISGTLNFCATTPLPGSGTGNTNVEPQLASDSHLSLGSPCVAAGSNVYASGFDIDGEPWATPSSIGCDEPNSGNPTGSVSINISANYVNVLPGFPVAFSSIIFGPVTSSRWEFGDGAIVSNLPYLSHSFAVQGDYPVILRGYNAANPGGITSTTVIHVISQPVHYVRIDNSSPNPPYTSWSTAATNIQDAIDAATVPGALVLVSNGIYSVGGRVMFGSMTNRVAVTKPLIVQSLEGPTATSIKGFRVPIKINDDASVRCVYLCDGAVLSGFTLTNGATRAAGDIIQEQSGGGVFCASTSAMVSNCVLGLNAASWNGGGTCFGTFLNCTFIANSATNSGGAAFQATLEGSDLIRNSASNGAGGYGVILRNCTLDRNVTRKNGGGVHSSVATNCIFISNLALAGAGAGAYNSTMSLCEFRFNSATAVDSSLAYNCSIVSNTGPGASSSVLSKCVLAGNSGGLYGGGAYLCSLTNCSLLNNAANYGGGSYSCTNINSIFSGNFASYNGGGASGGILNNCNLTGNLAAYGGGVDSAIVNNSIIYYNRCLTTGSNTYNSTLKFSCTTPLAAGAGNIDVEPLLASASHLNLASPCRQRGSMAYISGSDIDGETWASPPSLGCDEPFSISLTGAVSVAIQSPYSNIPTGFALELTGIIDGQVSLSRWEFGDGTILSNRPYASHSWSAAGDYQVVLRAYNTSNPDGVSSTSIIHVLNQPVHYVSENSQAPTAPYSSWDTAATNIQDAVDSAVIPGSLVLVTNGMYDSGGRPLGVGTTNRVVITNYTILRSVNGPEVTFIKGYQMAGVTNGGDAVRCVFLSNAAMIVGFTLTNGATWSGEIGGGAYCASPFTLISNCIFSGNSANVGGGVAYGTVKNSSFLSNSAKVNGGGAYGSSLVNCKLMGNLAATNGVGGGALDCSLYNCTVVSNLAGSGGGAFGCLLYNCIVYYNSAASANGPNHTSSTNFYSCIEPAGMNSHSFTNPPAFVNLAAGNLRLLSNSPCINAGSNLSASGTVDLDGNARIVAGTVDLGAYEFQTPSSSISYFWLQQYGLPTDGSADFTDFDGDKMSNWQEWVAGTDPTNSLSVLKLFTPARGSSAITLNWQSVAGTTYYLQRTTNLALPFTPVQSNIVGQVGISSYVDTNAPGSTPFFYRVGVQ